MNYHQLRAPEFDELDEAEAKVLASYSTHRTSDEQSTKRGVAYRLAIHHGYRLQNEDGVGFLNSILSKLEDVKPNGKPGTRAWIQPADKVLLDFIAAKASLRHGAILNAGKFAVALVMILADADDEAFETTLNFFRSVESGAVKIT